jgi:hypothetical protein
LKPSVVPGDCQLVRATTKSQSVGGRACGSRGSAPTRLTALHDSSEPPRVRLRARGDSRRQRRYPRSARRRPLHAGCIPHEPRGLIADANGHTPTKTESARNPVPPEVQKVLDRRRRFTLIRLGTLFHKSYATLLWRVDARSTWERCQVRRHAERVFCEARQLYAARRPRDGGGESFSATTCGIVAPAPKASVPGPQAAAPTARSSEVGGAQGWTPAPPPAEGSFSKFEIRNVEIRINDRMTNHQIAFLCAGIVRTKNGRE